MIVRSPSKITFVFLFAVLCVVLVWHKSPWSRARTYVYQRIPGITFTAPKQNPIPTENDYSTLAFTRPAPSLPDVNSHPRPEAGVSDLRKPKDSHALQNNTTPLPPWKTVQEKGSRVDSEGIKAGTEDIYIKEMLDWNRPNWEGHWPPFSDYVDQEYDPNRWEEFDYDHRFYTAGHHRLSAKIASNPVPYRPYPDYNSPSYQRTWHGPHIPCYGPRGVLLNTSADDQVQVYLGVPISFPKVFVGGYDVVGLNSSVCFDRYSRYGPYGFGDDEFPDDVLHWKAPQTVPEWDNVPWGPLQDDCLARNAERYRPGARAPTVKSTNTIVPDRATAEAAFKMHTDTASVGEDAGEERKKYHARTAVVIRAWTGYTYEQNDITAIRAMISELSLSSGGEYEIFLLVHVKDSSLDIFGNPTLYHKVLIENVPQELQSIALLWNEAIFPSWYPEVGDWQVYWHQFMCLQWFSLMHPQFDYVWNWETDARYTGHHYHFFETIGQFAAKQPRKLLWERNKRYYIPSVHGSYASFVEDTHASVLNASAHSFIPPPVWGPLPWPHALPPQEPLGPTPPTSFEQDNFQWGVSEQADFITLLPMWDPRNTTWSYKDKIWNYVSSVRPIFTPEDPPADAFTHPQFIHLDRRVFINTVARFSKKLLHAMHVENLAGRSMQAEMWPSTVALQHGLKAVYAPHPIFTDRHWPAPYAAAIFDASSIVDPFNGGSMQRVQGAWTEQEDSPYNHDREANFGGWSWYFASKFPRTLYRRWLGWKVTKQDWGEQETIEGGKGSDGAKEERRLCMPAMLLHPVKSMGKERVKM